MDFNLLSAVIAGIIGTAVMTVVLYMGNAMMGMKMDMPLTLGAMFLPVGNGARLIGLVIHHMNGAIFFAIYAALFSVLGIASGVPGWAALFGAVHGVMAGAVMAMMPMMHPRMAATVAAGPGQLPAPGFMGLNNGTMAPVAIVLLHVVYGLVAGIVYVALAG